MNGPKKNYDSYNYETQPYRKRYNYSTKQSPTKKDTITKHSLNENATITKDSLSITSHNLTKKLQLRNTSYRKKNYSYETQPY